MERPEIRTIPEGKNFTKYILTVLAVLMLLFLISCNKKTKTDYTPKYIIDDTLKYQETLEKLLIARPQQNYEHLKSIAFDMYKIENNGTKNNKK